MAMANMNLIGVFVTKLWPVQALACGGGGDGGDGGATKNIISPKFSNFGDIIIMFKQFELILFISIHRRKKLINLVRSKNVTYVSESHQQRAAVIGQYLGQYVGH